MLANFAYFQILGIPLLNYFGIFALLGFLIATTIAILNKKGITKISHKIHPLLGSISLLLALIHAFLAIASRF